MFHSFPQKIKISRSLVKENQVTNVCATINWLSRLVCSMYETGVMTKTCEEHIVRFRQNIPPLFTERPVLQPKNISIFCPHFASM